jgi:ABC-type spermidine/putrescine transport system permease subunit II
VAFLWVLLDALGDVVALEIAGGGKLFTPGLWIAHAFIHDLDPARGLLGLLGLVLLALPCAWLLARELRHSSASNFRRPPPAPRRLRILGWAVFSGLAALSLGLLAGDYPTGFDAQDLRLAGIFGRTAGIATLVGVVAATFGFLMAVWLRPTDSQLAGAALLLPLALPSSVYGLLALSSAGAAGLSPGMPLTILALLPQALALGFLIAKVLSSVVPRTLIETASDLGATGLDRLRMVWLPLGRPALLAAFAVVFTWVIGQSAIPAFTSGPGGDTLAVALTVVARGGDLSIVRRWALVIVTIPLWMVWIPTLWRRTP